MGLLDGVFGSKKPATDGDEGAEVRKAIVESNEIRLFRAAWNMDLSQKAIMAAALSAGVATASMALVVWFVAHPTPPEYFAVSPNGRITPIEALSTPLLSTAQLLSIAQQWSVDNYTFNYQGYRREFQKTATHFSKAAWAQWFASLNSKGIITGMQHNNWVVSAVPTDAPVIIAQGMVNGAYSWRIQMPMMVDYASNASHQDIHYVVTMVLQRAPTTQYANGVKIVQFVPQQTG